MVKYNKAMIEKCRQAAIIQHQNTLHSKETKNKISQTKLGCIPWNKGKK